MGEASDNPGREWLAAFAERQGRPLRVLHLGNVANNAYNNAKIQRQRGIEADVACWDYYHVMGCPEWEDAEFEGDYGDQFFPDWWNVDLKGFERPNWFAQGRTATCISYLAALRDDSFLRRTWFWRKLTSERWMFCRATEPARLARRASEQSFRWSHAVRWKAAALRRRLREPRDEVPVPPELDPAAGFGDEIADPHPDDYVDYLRLVPDWRDLFERYDIVQGYAVAPIIPVLCGIKTFTAYEHGTLRKTPFEDTPVGRMCARGFREAPIVFVTNTDVLPSARKLGIPDERLVCLPHAVDSERLLTYGAARRGGRRDVGDEVTFLAPARQDWVDRDPSWTKGNDNAIRAFAQIRADGRPCRLLLASWGRDLDASRELVRELGLEDSVSWLPPLHKRDLWDAYLDADAVLDQFVLEAIGGVTFEALALGRRVLTALDLDATRTFFGEAPPVLACKEPDEIAAAMRAVIADPLDEEKRGEAGREWFTRFHSADRIVDLQLDGYRRILENV